MQEKSREIAYLTEDVFFELVNELMEQQGASAKVPCEGLCSPSVLSEMTINRKLPRKMLRDRILESLGISEERSENLLDYEEYQEWLKRQRIVKAVMHREIAEAKKLLAEYKGSKTFEGKLEQQFYYAMQVQVMQYEDNATDEIRETLEIAVKLTVPNIDEKKITQLKLSLQELNLVLEYVRYKYPEQLKECCGEILEYLDNCAMEERSVVKMYPKVALQLCQLLHEEGKGRYAEIVWISNRAVEYLRNTQKNYYLWELLSLREMVLEQWRKKLIEQEKGKQAEALVSMSAENAAWKHALEAVYDMVKLPSGTKHFCHLYFQQEHYCIDEIIYNRRSALGLSRAKVNNGIYSKNTLIRLEKEHRRTRRDIVRTFFARLNLSGELHRTDVVLRSKREKELLEKLIKYANNFEVEKERETLRELEQCLDMNVPLNRQFIKGQQAILLYSEDKNNRAEAFAMMKEALEYTIPLETVRENANLYLTGCEINCLYNMAVYAEKEERGVYRDILLKVCERDEEEGLVEEHVSRYSWIMTAIAKGYSNERRHEEAIEVAEKNMRINLECGRLAMVAQNLNRISWNRMQIQKKSLFEDIRGYREENLEACIVLSRFCKEKYWENYYRKKREELEES